MFKRSNCDVSNKNLSKAFISSERWKNTDHRKVCRKTFSKWIDGMTLCMTCKLHVIVLHRSWVNAFWYKTGLVLLERGWSVNRIPGRQVKATRSGSNEFLSLKCISKFISFCSAYYWCKFSDLNFLKISKINVRTMKVINDGDWTVPSISFFNDTAIRYFHTI